MLAETVSQPEYDVPESETSFERCPYCERPFRTDELLIHHVGSSHTEVCTDEELEAYETVESDEEFELFTFHVKAAVTVFMVYFMFSFMYALVWA